MIPLPQSPEKILVWVPDRVSEAVLATPAVRTIRENFPEAELTLLVSPRVHDIFQFSPRVDRLLVYEKEGEHRGLRGMLQLVRELRQQQFAIVFFIGGGWKGPLITRLARIPVRAGYLSEGRGLLLTHGVHKTLEAVKKHEVDHYQRIMLGLGLRPSNNALELFLFGDQIDAIKARVRTMADFEMGNQPLIGFIPGATYFPSKRWPVENYAQLAQLICRDPRARIILFGSKAERATCTKIIAQSGAAAPRMLNMAGSARLIETIALLGECDVLVSSDSGLMHAAAALHVPIVALFGATDPRVTGPYSDNAVILHQPVFCSPCNKPRCLYKNMRCMKLISSDDVYAEVMGILAER